MKSCLAITWFEHRRTTELCDGLGVPLLTISTRKKGFLRYLLLGVRTLKALTAARPRALLVQNPSLVLAAMAVSLRFFLRYKLVVDAHNEAVQPVINRSKLILWLTHWVLRKSDLTIVTNRFLADVVHGIGATAFVLPDRVPQVHEVSSVSLEDGITLLFICTYAVDEPVTEVLESVRNLPVRLYVTGNDRKCDPAVRAAAPANVVFTGFLSEAEYWGHLAAAGAVIDLTTMPNCLVCGGYEAAALGKPLLLSRNEAAMELFGDAALYTDNTVADIRESIMRLQSQSAGLREEMAARREQLDRNWATSAAELAAFMTRDVETGANMPGLGATVTPK